MPDAMFIVFMWLTGVWFLVIASDYRNIALWLFRVLERQVGSADPRASEDAFRVFVGVSGSAFLGVAAVSTILKI